MTDVGVVAKDRGHSPIALSQELEKTGNAFAADTAANFENEPKHTSPRACCGAVFSPRLQSFTLVVSRIVGEKQPKAR
jgi:hypothetical protein